jgi:hypothetical protein
LCSTLAPSMSFVLSSMSLHTYINMHVFHETWLMVPKTHGWTPSDQLLFWWIRNNCLHKKIVRQETLCKPWMKSLLRSEHHPLQQTPEWMGIFYGNSQLT